MVRRAYNRHSHLINPAFQIDDNVLKTDRDIDNYYLQVNEEPIPLSNFELEKNYQKCFNTENYGSS